MTLQLTQSMNRVSAIKANIHTGWNAVTFFQIFPPELLSQSSLQAALFSLP